MLGKRGQTSLILILLAAAGLIFYAITLNWGRVAQNKVLLSIAADQTASLLASDAASYGEMEKSQYLGNTNRTSGFDGLLIDILMIVVAVVATIFSFGSTGPAWLVLLGEILSVVSVVVSVVNLALQLAVVQPGITALWNKLQKNQPVLQQFYEQGVGTALQGIVGDQVNVTDYFDLNTNTKFGLLSSDVANDTVGRFAFFYTDRLKMLNQKPMPNVQFFYDQLGEFINGESCAQNEYDASIYPNISVNPSCLNLG